MAKALQSDPARAADRAAALLLAAAVVFATYLLVDAAGTARWSVAVASGGASWLLANFALHRMAGEPALSLTQFETAPFEFFDDAAEEAVAGDAPIGEDEDELLLEDALELVSDQSQVVRLFDPSRMPTAGELQERIDRHLAAGPREVPDSTQELYAALLALRHSLR